MENIEFFRNTFLNPDDYLFTSVIPYRGKYAVNCKDFFLKVEEIQEKKMKREWKYRPINSEIEITNCCNDHCKHCGMASNGMGGISYNKNELIDYINELWDNGIISVSITGGEPFVRFAEILTMIKNAVGKVDICKLTTNGFWGDKAEEILDKLEEAGLFCNRYFIPCLMLSIGEQSVPLEKICHIIHVAISRYSIEMLTLCISSMSEYGKSSKIVDLIKIYNSIYGNFPKQKVFLTENYYRNNDDMMYKANDTKGRLVEDYMNGPVHCFAKTVGMYVLPRMLVKADGSVATCACFNPPKELLIGNIKEQSIRDVLNEINKSEYVSIIADNGLHAFKYLLNEDKYKNVTCNNECDACKILIEAYDTSKNSSY